MRVQVESSRDTLGYVRNHEGIDQPNMGEIFPIFIQALCRKTVCILTQSTKTIKEVKDTFQARIPVSMEDAV